MEHVDHDPHHDFPPPEGDTQGMGYEHRDTNIRAIVMFGVGLIIVIVAAELVLLAAYRPLVSRRNPPDNPKPVENIGRQMRNLYDGQEATLREYGWVDRKAGVVRLPIDRAIDLVAERGVPKGKGPRTEAEINSDRGSPAPAATPDEKTKP
jgi:hypothetical protein